MKLFLKYVLYSLIIIILVSGTVLLYKTHPEAQLACLIPGIFILTFSKMSDDLNFRKVLPRYSKEK